ncbi:unnamed protein product [Thlaspi arvense]|uniref:Cathepsin propeptide inhibitor domain-containing protein n=1 Tax=Thlaspi arvense TaxID=13288 RepID=A0AAU9SN88_THLAR|nr:unnamed protein product [Thlaspi arvense]
MGNAKSAMLILLLAMLIACATAMDMSVVSYDEAHHVTTSPDRSQSVFDAEAVLIFESWMVKHGKVYDSVAEKERRLTIFEDNLRFITNRNAENRGYRLGLTRFADLSLHEYNEVCHGADPTPPRNHVFMTTTTDTRLVLGNNNNVMIDGYENLPSNDELTLRKAVAHQPITAIIDSSSREYQLYES